MVAGATDVDPPQYTGPGDGSLVYTGFAATVTAGDGDNTIVATDGCTYITDGTGNDAIFLLAGPNAGSNSIILGNGNNAVTLTGSYNSVIDGTGNDTIWASTSGDWFTINSAGGNDSIFNFNNTDTIDLSGILSGLGLTPTEAGLSGNITVTQQADDRFGTGAQDTSLTVTGTAGTAQITLMNYDAGGLAGLLANNSLALPS